MPSGVLRVWVDGIAYETTYTSAAHREKEITRILIDNSTLKTRDIIIDIIPRITERYVLQEAKRGGYDWSLQEKARNRERMRQRYKKTLRSHGSNKKKGLCHRCIGIAVYRISDCSNNYSFSI